MEFSKLITERRSVRAFTQRKLTRNEIDYILTAAINAPSACNFQSWHFICVADADMKERFKSICADWVSTAPMVIIVCTDSAKLDARWEDREKTYKFTIQDTALAMENMLLAAADIGLGGCIIGAYDQDKCVREFNISDKYLPVALLPIGEPVTITPQMPRKPVSDVVTFIGDVLYETEDQKHDDKPFELRSSWIPNAVFDDLGMPNALFNNVNLSGASFTDINLAGSSFADINFTGSSFKGLNLSDSSYGCVELNNAVFKNVEFKNARFEDCDFQGATIDGISLLDSLNN